MEVTLHRSFQRMLEAFAGAIKSWKRDGHDRLVRKMRRIGQKHKAEAVKRVPVDEGRLRNGILTNTYEEKFGQIFTETGTNIRGYPVFVEFGTKFIAGGRVKALGDGPEITDDQAIKEWPAKMEGLEGFKTDKQGRLRDTAGRYLAGGGREQMPWLRPSFMKIRDWAVGQIDKAMRPPEQK